MWKQKLAPQQFIHHSFSLTNDCKWPQVYFPQMVSDGSLSGLCQEVLQEIAENKEERRVLYPHAVFVYVNLCDIDGTPTEDKYV